MSTASRSSSGNAPAPTADRLWRTDVGGELSFLLARANALSLARVNAALADHSLKVRSYSVLAVIVGDARPSQRELSEFLRLDPSQIVSIVDELESRGLVRREPDPTDRRANVVIPTAAGHALHEAMRSAARAAEEELLAPLDAAQVTALAAALRALAGAPAAD